MSRSKLSHELRGALYSARYVFLAIGIVSLFLNLLMLVAPFYMLQIYDRVLSSQSKDTLYVLTFLAVGLLLVGGLLELIRSRILVRLGARLNRHMTHDLFDTLVRDRIATQQGSGIQPVRDMESVRSFLTGPGLTAFFDAPWTPVFIGIIFLFHPWLGSVALAGAVILFAVAIFSEVMTRRPLREANEETQRAHRLAESTLRNADVVWGMGMLGDLRRRWQIRHFSALGHTGKATDYIGSSTAFAKFLRPGLQIGILGLGAYLVIEEQITAGVMIAASILMGRALAPIEAAISHWRGFVAARSAYARMIALLNRYQVPEDRVPLPTPEGNVSVEGATLVPPGSERATLFNVSFQLPAGEMLGVIGPSAAGKSSLARMLIGIWPPKLGHVRLDGAEVADWDREEFGKHVGYLPQDVELFDGTVAENIARFQEGSSDNVIQAAKLANAHEMILRLSNGYDTWIGEGGAILSGGQRQRVGLARALYMIPRMIILDEPNSNLDSNGEEALRATLRYMKELRRTVIIISHKRSILSDVDKLLVMDNGRIMKFGPRDQILEELFTPRVVREPQPSVEEQEAAQNDG